MRKWRCDVCGYVHEGEAPPAECPVCGAPASKFVEVVEEAQAGDTGLGQAGDPEAAGAGDAKSGRAVGGLAGLILDHHVHPIAVHTPNGIVPVAAAFLLLALFLNAGGFEQAAFYNMVVVLLAMPVVLFSGFIEWREHYNGARTSVFFTKIACGLVVLATGAVLVVWRLADPLVMASGSRWLYILLYLVALGAVGMAGHLGGKLVFGRRR